VVVVVVCAVIQNMRADVCCVRPIVNGDSRIAAAACMLQGGGVDGGGQSGADRMGGRTFMTVKTPCLIVLGLALGLGFATDKARADAAETLIEECHVQLDMSANACDCIGSKARDELSPQQQDFVVAQVTEDQAAVQELQSQMTTEEMTQAAEWMMSAPAACEEQ
jgi:hypothetical protein